jgi:hypothetical protein
MLKYILSASLLLATPAIAVTWATGDCTAANGGRIRYIVHDGSGYITYGNDGPYEMFSKRDGDMGIITHIGSGGNMVLAVDLNTGRGYIITRFDNGRTVEYNVSCRLGSANK